MLVSMGMRAAVCYFCAFSGFGLMKGGRKAMSREAGRVTYWGSVVQRSSMKERAMRRKGNQAEAGCGAVKRPAAGS